MNKRKSVLLLTLSTFNYDARVKTYAYFLRAKGYDVAIVSSKEMSIESSKTLNEGFVNYRVITKYRGESGLTYVLYYLKFLIKAFFRISLISFRKRFDIIHYNNAPNFIIFSCVLQKILGSRIILDNHDIFPLVFSAKFKNSLLYKIALLEQKLSMKFANKVLCADHNQYDYLKECGIKQNKMTIVLNIPNPDFFEMKTEESIRANKTINMVYHGTISHRLGLDNILEGINLRRDQLNNFKFHLIGTGDYLDEVRKLNDKLNLNDKVIIYGKNIPVEELKKYLNKMDMGIIANRLTDISDYMLPVKLLEYVYTEIPVIAPRNKIITRYFSEDMLCFYEPENVEEMAEKIVFLYNNKDARERFAVNAFKFSEQYNYETEMSKYEKIIKDLTG